MDVSWNLLSDDCYEDLRSTIYSNPVEEARFRQLVVNSVMATDIMDKDLKNLRNARWEKAFSENSDIATTMVDNVNRKATIVIEHLIQASDVAHTMQHWHIYRKWNERLFFEMNLAYHEGRSETDPATNWYKGELGFFDFYIIPLAKKLKDCGVFGVSSDEYLSKCHGSVGFTSFPPHNMLTYPFRTMKIDYAETNRKEWESRGKEVVSEMVENFKKKMKRKHKKRMSLK